MPFITSVRCQEAYWLIAHSTVLRALFFAFGLILASNAHGAGCSHRFEYTSNGLDPFGKPLASNVQKVYSGGEFKYYVLPVGQPCKGPNCRGTPPMNMTSVPIVIANDRFDLTFLTDNSIVGLSHYCDRSIFWSTVRPISQMHAGLLRPPAA